jgi:UDP-4-amino-4,6-dideoxy-N-acetyl-beta-L-altrosamine transaminase
MTYNNKYRPDKPIRYGRQEINKNDIDAVVEVLKSNLITQGPKVKEFEKKFAEYVGSKYAVAVSNGTAALHISAKSLSVGVNSRVITTPITFVATPNCVRFCGGEVYFADIDPDTYLLDPEKVRKLIEAHPKNHFEGIIPVDFAGRSVDMEEFRKIADEHGLWIIEDAAHAPGGSFVDSNGENQQCGNGKFADLAIFSFHPVKHIACGEGGMITTNDEFLYKKLLRIRSHGITSDQSLYTNDIKLAIGEERNDAPSDFPGWYMEMQNLGFNYRLTDIQSALGVSQLGRAALGIKKRREIAKVYNDVFKDKDYILDQSGAVEGHAYHLYIIHVKDRLGLYKCLMESNIIVQIHYIPAHFMPYYQVHLEQQPILPFAESYYKSCMSLPMYPTLSKEDQLFVIQKIDEYYNLK